MQSHLFSVRYRTVNANPLDEGRKRVILNAASIFAARNQEMIQDGLWKRKTSLLASLVRTKNMALVLNGLSYAVMSHMVITA
jgi:hypothetical protein